jgi:uncharacterized protein
LANRQATDRMSYDVMATAFDRIFASDLFTDPISLVWHAGQPLTLPVDYYRTAFDLADERALSHGRRLRHSIQTNGTLIDESWLKLFRAYDVGVGVSVDGPAFIHDRFRVSRSGGPTHAKVMRGLRLLQQGGISPTVIMVLTRFALDYPDEVFDFFLDHGIKYLGFNINEIEGTHHESTYLQNDAVETHRRWSKARKYSCVGSLVARNGSERCSPSRKRTFAGSSPTNVVDCSLHARNDMRSDSRRFTDSELNQCGTICASVMSKRDDARSPQRRRASLWGFRTARDGNRPE